MKMAVHGRPKSGSKYTLSPWINHFNILSLLYVVSMGVLAAYILMDSVCVCVHVCVRESMCLVSAEARRGCQIL